MPKTDSALLDRWFFCADNTKQEKIKKILNKFTNLKHVII